MNRFNPVRVLILLTCWRIIKEKAFLAEWEESGKETFQHP